MAKENENLESTEETVEEVVADKGAEQEHLDRQKEEEESIALASEKAKEKAKRAKTKKTRDAGKPSSGGRFLGGLALVAVSALVGAGAMYVSLGNKTTEETTLVSMKGDTVTVGDVFDSLKGSSQTQQSVLSATLQKALEKEYGSKVSKEDVDKAYKQASEQYGDQFSQVLAAYGQTEESYRNQIRTQKLVEYAVNQ
ncbi:MAG: foldase PrsA, partial [Streptococcus sp.]|nr:foldase PrsA [Streptococcus sp.]